VCFAGGVVYVGAGSFLFALDAKTGKPIQDFGKNGQASVILDVVKMRYPEVAAAITLGYWFTTAPQYYNGVPYIGSTRSESHIPGGHVLAVDAKTGDELWKFNTGAGVFGSPSTYMVNGEQFVTVASGGGERGRRGGDLILSFALPKP
jgi:glucose dehydrogenase